MPRAVVLASLAAAAEAFVASGPTVAALRMRPRVRLDGAGADSGTGALSLRAVGQRPSSAVRVPESYARSHARTQGEDTYTHARIHAYTHTHAQTHKHTCQCALPFTCSHGHGMACSPARLLRSVVSGVRVRC